MVMYYVKTLWVTLGLKEITCVSANMPKKKNRVGRSENLFIFCLIFVC